jgi:hypothetical protein
MIQQKRRYIVLLLFLVCAAVFYLDFKYNRPLRFKRDILLSDSYRKFIETARKKNSIDLFIYNQFGMAGNSTFESVLYDKKREILLPDSDRSTEWRNAMRNLNYSISVNECDFKIIQLEYDSFMLTTRNC